MRTNQEDGTLVPGVHRSIRSLAPGEGPWPGTLVTDGDEVGVWCDLDRADLGIDWRFAGAAHVAAPTDIARFASGHGAIMPWCTARVSTFLARRTAAEAPLEPGELGTLVLSMLRGLREIADRADPDLAGQWWLTEAGRPLCVPGGSATARSAVVDIISSAQSACADRALRRMLLGIQESIAAGMPTTARVRGWERELLEFAAPRALRVDEHAPQSARDASIAQIRAGTQDTPARRRVRSRQSPLPSLIAERLARTAARIPHRLPSRPAGARTDGSKRHAPRRRILLIAGGSAAAVLCAGALWPGEEPTSSQAAESALVGAATPTVTPPATPAPDASVAPSTAGPEETTGDAPSGADDPAATTTVVLAALDACVSAADEECAGAIAAGSSARASQVLRSEAAGDPVLVDDYGDLAVIRLGSDPAHEQMLVLVRQDEKWLVRDVYDVADQPGDG
ncbi:hypothetical protein [Microbacterium sp. ZKA21]|uniref:hypothetical protein n=1 Tax=Microbacterium sp. ZKA21 TaxID=3381694 RepID=UPI003D215677